MARQILALSGLDVEDWHGAVLLDPALVEGGGIAYLRYIRVVGNDLHVRLSATADEDPEDAGPAFTAALEGAERAFTFADGGDTLTLKGPGHPDNINQDLSEPYLWTPGNSAALRSWFASARDRFTLTLDDGPSVHVIRGTAVAGSAAARARVAAVTAHAIRSTAVAGGAIADARVAAVPALALSDFDAEGLEIDVLALIRAGAGDAIYAAPPRGTVGTLLDGELGFGADEALITRIRRVGGSMLLINDDSPLFLRSYFGPGGAGQTLSLYIQTRRGVASLPATIRASTGGNYVNFGPLDAAFRAIADGIAEGERFIIAFARQAHAVVALRGKAAAAGAEAAAGVLRVTPSLRALRGRAAAGEPRAAARLAAIRVHALRGNAATGAPQARARLATGYIRALRGAALAGTPQARARLAIGYIRALRGRAVAGPSEAAVHVVRVASPAARYARTLHESAPADALLTALEIEHPAAAQPVRVVNDTRNRRIEGHDYVALRFDARLSDDVGGQAPQAELAVDNAGRALTQWIEATGGGVGATVRVMLVLDIEDPPVEWEVTLDVAGMAVDQERVTARLGFDPLLGRAAVALRHDPQTSPGLF